MNENSIASVLKPCSVIQCPSSVPGWFAPVAIIGALGLLVSIFNLFRSLASDKYNQKVGPSLAEFERRVATPLESALQNLVEVNVVFRVGSPRFQNASSKKEIQERIVFFDEFQKNTLDPARIRFSTELQQADSCKQVHLEGSWQAFDDRLDTVLDLMNDFRIETSIKTDDYRRMSDNFVKSINETAQDVNKKIEEARSSVSMKYKITFLGLVCKKGEKHTVI